MGRGYRILWTSVPSPRGLGWGDGGLGVWRGEDHLPASWLLLTQTQNRGKRMKEGAPINRSLLALGNCINALSEKGRQPGAICELPGQQTHARLLKV